MTCSSCLSEDLATLVLDTSVIINLHASTFGERIVAALPNEVVVPEFVIQDLDHETSRTGGEYQFLYRLINHGVLRPIDMDDDAWDVFEKLVAAPSSIGDGEASVIAIANSLGLLPVMDDGKGRAQAAFYVKTKIPAWSLDLLIHPDVQAELVGGQFAEAIYLALREGRMRIDEERCDAVVRLIGVERALACTSLPNYRVRRNVWQSLRD